mmetsp:Transcript_115530/g.333764  ORF Transcript_115530/g.333764 Transcript_115530/m.333764 type:complete len:262 (-) Transcript_115530:1214-1999(-)
MHPDRAHDLAELLDALRDEVRNGRSRLLADIDKGTATSGRERHEGACLLRRRKERRTKLRRPSDLLAWRHGIGRRGRRCGRRPCGCVSFESISNRREGGHEALRGAGEVLVRLAVGLGQSSVATSGMAHLVPGALPRPRGHPRLHVGRPTLHAAFLLQQPTLAVDLLEGAADHDEHPHADHRDASAAEQLPWQCRRRRPPSAPSGNFVTPLALGGLHLLLETRLLRRFRRGDHVDRLLEGRGQRPLLRPPWLPGGLLALLN